MEVVLDHLTHKNLLIPAQKVNWVLVRAKFTYGLDRATIQFRVFGPNSFNTALQSVLRPHFLVHFV
jgi:hypothetical protein